MREKTSDFLIRLMLTMWIFWPIPLLFYSLTPLLYIIIVYLLIGFVIFTPPRDAIAPKFLQLWWVIYTWYEYIKWYCIKDK